MPPPALPRPPALLPFQSSPGALSALLLALSSARALSQGQQLHAHLFKSGSIPSLSFPLLSNHFITFYSRCSLPLLSYQAFLDSPLKSPASWSALLASLAQNGLPVLALRSFCSALAHGVPLTDRTLPLAAKSCAALGLAPLGRGLHALAFHSGLQEDVFSCSALMDMYAKCGALHDARRLFDEMPRRNVVSWSAIICGHADAALNMDALTLFKRALGEAVRVNDFTYSCVVRVCAGTTLLELGSQVHAHCFKTSFDSSPFVGSSLISLYSKCGEVYEAYRVFHEMPERNLGAWNAVLIASAQHGHTRAAFERFKDMEAAGFAPNFITFLCLLTACSHAGLVGDGKRYFNTMVHRSIEPGPQHYACMVDLLGRAGRLKEAVEFVEAMPMEPTESVWGALLTGCRIHGDTETAAFAAQRLFDRTSKGSLSSGAHMLLANAYAAAGRYADAACARKAMRDYGVRKETGLSWVEWAGCVHTFVSGDTSHPLNTQIYKKLQELAEKMEREGYVVDTSYVLRDLDGEEKKRAIWYHSERLAIGFGLLSVPEGRPIKIMKNLRVCGDCHTAIKFITRCTGRTVILRDNNRFHRLENGVCSCGDYW